MKKLFALLVLVSFFFICHAQTGIKDKDVFVRRIFAAVQENDTAAFLKLFPDKEGMKRLLTEYIRSIKDTIEKAQTKTFFAEFDTMSDATFNKEIREKMLMGNTDVQLNAKSLNIDLSKAIFTNWEEKMREEDKESPIKSFSGYIYFQSNSKDYTLSFKEIIWSETDQCYYGVSLKTITEKGKEAEAELDVNKMIKNALESNKVSEPPPPPPPAKKRTTVKKAPASPAKKTTIKH